MKTTERTALQLSRLATWHQRHSRHSVRLTVADRVRCAHQGQVQIPGARGAPYSVPTTQTVSGNAAPRLKVSTTGDPAGLQAGRQRELVLRLGKDQLQPRVLAPFTGLPLQRLTIQGIG